MNLKNTFTIFSITFCISTTLASNYAYSHEHDDPLLASLVLDKLEFTSEETSLEADAWIGKDINKLWLKTDIKIHDKKTEHAELQALYSHAISPYWDLQTGIRKDIEPSPSRTWGVVGVQGLAPYFFEIDAAIFVGEAGRTAARFSAEYDVLITQNLILSPEIQINFYGQGDAATSTGSGLSDAEAGLRLRYEICREFAPYIGVNWSKKFGKTADSFERQGNSISDTSLVAGAAFWF
ncbi:hypothetical protein GCM10011613_11840 [Cellvibrio zantedeschiae]|uniref:Copper resistance protein CopB n=1 Tax=Cellvibrio zantedeschiae TaxID=1237077 RepID=A0ABQ3AZU8_9GAMM|nr:copper resistance protein B [Cellvibrio zantedeschiae]GGY69157.1 hypothetical protein GCM10011613_11840 [Cellvibrio zantedeschiae]